MRTGSSLTGPGTEISSEHSGVRSGLAEAVQEGRRERARTGLPVRADSTNPGAAGELPLGRAARLLGQSFLPEPVRGELGRALAAAERAHQPVRLGLAVPAGLAGLPWEALPAAEGAARWPCTRWSASTAKRTRQRPGCCRGHCGSWSRSPPPTPAAARCWIMSGSCATCWPRSASARQDAADVRVVPFATPGGDPGRTGPRPRPCAAHLRARLPRPAVPGKRGRLGPAGHRRRVPGPGDPARADAPGDHLVGLLHRRGWQRGRCLVRGPAMPRGAAAVIATETSITDTYATRLLARVYGTLAQASEPDVVSALSEARRQVQAELETSPDKRDNELAGLGEWAAVTVLAASGSVPVLDPGRTAPAVSAAVPAADRRAGRPGGLVFRRAAARTAPLARRT